MTEARWPTRRDVVAGAGLIGLSVALGGAGEPELEAEMTRLGLTGTFACLDVVNDSLTMAYPARAERRFIPASTFKIANALIALETGAVRDDREVFHWDGAPRDFKSWEQDMTLRQAIPASNVPVFQEIARRVGLKRYEEWLEKLDYGNREVGDNVERFWLDGPLAISAIEQARFLAFLARSELQMSKRSQELVRDMLKFETKDGQTLYAKTGWCTSTTPNIGWWVGWIEVPGAGAPQIHTFALNIDMAGADDAPKRFALGRAMLSKLSLL